jgi:hypothetical protein
MALLAHRTDFEHVLSKVDAFIGSVVWKTVNHTIKHTIYADATKVGPLRTKRQ